MTIEESKPRTSQRRIAASRRTGSWVASLCLAGVCACSSPSNNAFSEAAGGASNTSGGAAQTAGGAQTAGASGTPVAGASSTGAGGVNSTAGAGGNTQAGYTSAGGAAGGASLGGASAAGSAGVSGGQGGAGGASTSGGGSSSGGASGGSTFQPCPTNGDPCKILPLGDSITWGIQYEGAYRVELFTKAVAAGQKITFTGSLSDGPTTVAGMPFPQQNEGHSGWTIAQEMTLVPSPAFTTIPNIVLLMIGTNDIYAASGQSTMPDRLGMLVDSIIQAAPDALLVVAKITPLSMASWNQTIATYNSAIPGVLQTRMAAGKHVLLADMNTGFMVSSMLSSDGIHPNQTGYNFMGDTWYAAISSYLPK